MFQDICFPNNNEKEFAEVALRLGTKALIFVYEFKDLKNFEQKKRDISEIKNIKIDFGALVDEKSINKIQMVDAHIFVSTPSKQMIENKKTYILFDFEKQDKNDFLHHRNSGLNQVMCKLMKENDKILGISFSSLLNSKNKGVMLGRMQQNARFSRKYKLKTVVASFALTPYELRAEHEIVSFKKILSL